MKTLALLLLFTGSCAAMEQKAEQKVEQKNDPIASIQAGVFQLAFLQMQAQRLTLKGLSLQIKEMPAGNNKQQIIADFTPIVEQFVTRAQENMRDCTVHHIKIVRGYKREIKLALQTLNNL